MSLLKKGLKALEIDPEPEQIEFLQSYMDELEFWNQKYGLVKVDTREELESRHILDSLSGLPFIAEEAPELVADLGSGAGLPGIPLAIFMPQTQFFLVERSGRRCRFLENMKIHLQLDNIEILNQDLNQVDITVDLVTFRAFRPFEEEILKGILEILKPGGILAAYKGTREKTGEELEQLKPFFKEGRMYPLNAPFQEQQRNMLWMRY